MEVLPILIKFLLAVDALLLFGFFFAFFNGMRYRPHFRRSLRMTSERKFTTLREMVFHEHWQAILLKMASGTPDALKVSIIDADKLADDALKKLGLEGEHMADRLERLDAEDFKTLPKLQEAHRVRNELVHTPGFTVSALQAREVLKAYEEFLKEVGVL